jgi:hypothetical protein
MSKFHYSDVLSVSDGRLVSSRHIDGVYDVIGAITGEEVDTIDLLGFGDSAAAYLKKLYPVLGLKSVESAITEALDEFAARGGADNKILKLCLDKHVLPLVLVEKFNVPKMGEAELAVAQRERDARRQQIFAKFTK